MWTTDIQTGRHAHKRNATERETLKEAHRYLVEEVESLDVGLFSVEKLFGDVQELLSLGALRETQTHMTTNVNVNRHSITA